MRPHALQRGVARDVGEAHRGRHDCGVRGVGAPLRPQLEALAVLGEGQSNVAVHVPEPHKERRLPRDVRRARHSFAGGLLL